MCQAWGITSLDHPSPWKLSKRPSLSRGYSYNALNLGNLGHTKVSEGGGNSRKVAPFQSSRFRPPGGGAGYPRGNPRGCLLSPRWRTAVLCGALDRDIASRGVYSDVRCLRLPSEGPGRGDGAQPACGTPGCPWAFCSHPWGQLAECRSRVGCMFVGTLMKSMCP